MGISREEPGELAGQIEIHRAVARRVDEDQLFAGVLLDRLSQPADRLQRLREVVRESSVQLIGYCSIGKRRA